MFIVNVMFTLFCFAIKEGQKLQTEHYLNFFKVSMVVNWILISINLVSNMRSGNDCGLYSLRGFAAGLITVCTLTSVILVYLLDLSITLFDKFNSYLK
jgi:hypothetical protein